MQYLLDNKTKATFWIDNSGLSSATIASLLEEYLEQKKEVKDIPEEIRQEAIVSPKEVKHAGMAEINGNDNSVCVSYQKDEHFIVLMHQLRMKWDGEVWMRELNEQTGLYVDRAAEIANLLLREGFVINLLDVEAREKAINATFKQEQKRWFMKVKDKEELALRWEKGAPDDLYKNARRIVSSRYENYQVVVPVSQYKTIESYADTYGFSFSKKAESLIESYKKRLEIASKETPAVPAKQVSKDKLKEILKSDGAILEDLEDE